MVALAKQVLDVPFGGLETKLDPKLVPLGRSLTLENAEFGTIGAIKKRNGYTALARTLLAGSSISAGVAIAGHKDELLMLDGTKLYSYASGDATWVDKGKKYCVSAASRDVAQTAGFPATAITSVSAAYANGVLVYAWNGGATISYAIVDAATGNVLAGNSPSMSDNAPKMVALGTNIVLLYAPAGTTNIKYMVLDTNTPTGFGAEANLVTDASSTAGLQVFDIAAVTSSVGVLIYRSSTPSVKVVRFNTSGTTGSTTTIAETPTSRMCAVVTAASQIFLSWATAAAIRVTAYSSDLSSNLFAAKNIEALANITTIVGAETSTANEVQLYYEVDPALSRVKKAKVNNAGTITSAAAEMLRGASIATKAFKQGSTVFVGALVHEFTNQRTIVIVDDAGVAAAKLLPTEITASLSFATTPVDEFSPTEIVSTASGVWLMPLIKQAPISATAHLVAEGRLDFNYRPQFASVGDSLLISGGIVSEYDGERVAEHNFHFYPEISLAQSAAGGSMSNGTYGVIAVFVTLDSRGRVIRSALSDPQTITLTGGGAAQLITVTAKTLRMTQRAALWVSIYRTTNGGSTYYLATSSELSVSNDTTADTVAVVTSMTDASLIAQAQLYTTDGTLEVDVPPALRSIVRKGNRLFGATDDGRVYHTREILPAESPSFSEELYFDVGNGEPLELALLDDSLVAFAPNDIYAIAGNGPNDQGLLSDLSTPRTVATDVGVEEGTPLLATDEGIFFRSPQGLRLLTRSLQVDPVVGYPVESFNTLSLKSVVLVPEKNQVRFGHSDGNTLVYDYAARSWSVFTNHTQVGACVWQGNYCLLKSDGTVWAQGAVYTDGDGASITMKVDTPWIKLGNLQGFQRAYRCVVLGTWKSAHTLSLKCYYDYSETVAETDTKDTSSGYSADDVLQLRHHMGKKCEAVRFRIEDSAQAGTKESAVLSGLALELGGMGGVFRLPSTKTI